MPTEWKKWKLNEVQGTKAAFNFHCEQMGKDSIRSQLLAGCNGAYDKPSVDFREKYRDMMLKHMAHNCPALKAKTSKGETVDMIQNAVVAFQLRKRCLYCGKRADAMEKEFLKKELDVYNALRNKNLARSVDYRMEEAEHRVRQMKLERSQAKEIKTLTDRRLEKLHAEKNRLLTLLRGDQQFKSLRETILWLLSMKKKEKHLSPFISMEDAAPCSFIQNDLAPNIKNIIFGQFLAHEETARFAYVCKYAFDYVYHNDAQGPWKDLSMYDPMVLKRVGLVKPDGLQQQPHWRLEFVQGRLRCEAEKRKCLERRGRGLWLGHTLPFWKTLPDIAKSILTRCRVVSGVIKDHRRLWSGSKETDFKDSRWHRRTKTKRKLLPEDVVEGYQYEQGVPGKVACEWLERNEPYVVAHLECRYGPRRFFLDFSDCAYVGLRHETPTECSTRVKSTAEMDSLLADIQHQQQKLDIAMRKKGKKKVHNRVLNKAIKKLNTLKQSGKDKWSELKQMETIIPERSRATRRIDTKSLLKLDKLKKHKKVKTFVHLKITETMLGGTKLYIRHGKRMNQEFPFKLPQETYPVGHLLKIPIPKNDGNKTIITLSPGGDHVAEISKRVRQYLAKNISRAIDLFRKMDTSGDGYLDKDELEHGLTLLGLKFETANDFDLFWSSIDRDGSGVIDAKELIESVGKKRRKASRNQAKLDGAERVINRGSSSVLFVPSTMRLGKTLASTV